MQLINMQTLHYKLIQPVDEKNARIVELETNYNLLKTSNDEKDTRILELETQYESLLSKLKLLLPDLQ